MWTMQRTIPVSIALRKNLLQALIINNLSAQLHMHVGHIMELPAVEDI